MDPLPRKVGFVFWGHVAAGALYGMVALVLRLADPLGLDAVRAAYLGALFLLFLCIGFLMPAWFSILGDLVPEGSRGRVLVRASGTEPLVRVMVEAPTAEQARSVADQLAASIRARA